VKPTVSSKKALGPGGAERFDPFRVGVPEGLYPWAAGTESVPWPTATQFEPLRNWEGSVKCMDCLGEQP